MNERRGRALALSNIAAGHWIGLMEVRDVWRRGTRGSGHVLRKLRESLGAECHIDVPD